jgi:hypothetical protein
VHTCRRSQKTYEHPTLHIKSWHSMGVSWRPAARWNVATVKWNRSLSGSGPDARPPMVTSRAPAGRSLDRSHFGVCPAYSAATSARSPSAHPRLLSSTTSTGGAAALAACMATTGSCSVCAFSTENPTPVPDCGRRRRRLRAQCRRGTSHERWSLRERGQPYTEVERRWGEVLVELGFSHDARGGDLCGVAMKAQGEEGRGKHTMRM